jgi:hypothetical protein
MSDDQLEREVERAVNALDVAGFATVGLANGELLPRRHQIERQRNRPVPTFKILGMDEL